MIPTNTKHYWFGTMERPGHFYHSSEHNSTYEAERIVPWNQIDGRWAPREDGGRECPQGQCVTHVESGWTVVAFWDRTHDKRGACNSALVVEGEWAFDEVVALFRETFPNRMAEMAFELDEVG